MIEIALLTFENKEQCMEKNNLGSSIALVVSSA